MSYQEEIPKGVLKAFSALGKILKIEPITMGLINKTYKVITAQKIYILQELSPIFDVVVNEDSRAVSCHLSKYNIVTPEILLTDQNELFFKVEGRVFRALKFIDGYSFQTVTSTLMAQSAGQVLGQFHEALKNFNYDFLSKRRHGSDYTFHKNNLITALKQHTEHEYFSRVEPLAITLIRYIEEITLNLSTTARNAHGDPKISNIIFNHNDEAVCMVDFDTLGKTGWSLEMADALRSWCNPYPEDVLDAHVDLLIAEAALKGYGLVMRGHFSHPESEELIRHTESISLCLSIRYLTDVLNECYWAYDKSRFLRPADHNLLRASAMLNLAKDFAAKRETIAQMVKDYLL